MFRFISLPLLPLSLEDLVDKEKGGKYSRHMAEMKLLEDKEALRVLEKGDFSPEFLGEGSRILIVLTQSWCPDWFMQRQFLLEMAERPQLKIYFLEYDKVNYSKEFRKFKEDHFKNNFVPYLRFYKDGQFDWDTNFASSEEILAWAEGD